MVFSRVWNKISFGLFVPVLVVSPRLLAHGAEVVVEVGARLNGLMDALAWLIMSSLIVWLVIRE